MLKLASLFVVVGAALALAGCTGSAGQGPSADPWVNLRSGPRGAAAAGMEAARESTSSRSTATDSSAVGRIGIEPSATHHVDRSHVRSFDHVARH